MSTEYVVLKLDGSENDASWWPVKGSPVEASNDQQAIRDSTAKLAAEQRAGTFVAIPTRSFRPRTREIETKEVDRWT